MDQYKAIRELPPLAVLSALGVDTSTFKRRKDEWNGRCPIHQSKNNVTCFSINDDGRFHCFSCEAKGSGMLDMVKQIRQCGFKDAVAFLEPLLAITPTQAKKEPLEAPVASGDALQPLLKDSWRKFAQPCEWLEKRVPDARIRELYGVYMYNNPQRKSAYSGRVMIPVKDSEGVLFGYLGRALNPSDTKYLFPSGLAKSRFLFGAHELRQHLAGISSLPSSRYKEIYLVESPFCVLKFASMGLPAVSPFGWSVSEEQVNLLAQICKGVVYLPDANKYNKARTTMHPIASRLWLRFPPLPDGIDDPEHLSLEQILALTH